VRSAAQVPVIEVAYKGDKWWPIPWETPQNLYALCKKGDNGVHVWDWQGLRVGSYTAPDNKKTSFSRYEIDFVNIDFVNNGRLRTIRVAWADLAAVAGPPCWTVPLVWRPPHEPYRVNAEQLDHTALFGNGVDVCKPWLRPDEVLMTIIADGGGGCGKTTLAVEIIVAFASGTLGNPFNLRVRRVASASVKALDDARVMDLSVSGIPAQRNRSEVYGGMPILWYSPDAA